jgi:hypothetical protein
MKVQPFVEDFVNDIDPVQEIDIPMSAYPIV